MSDISFIKLSSNGDKMGLNKIKEEDVNTRRLGQLYKLVPSSIFLSYEIGGDVSTIWPRSDGTFNPMSSYYDYYVNGDPDTSTSNPNVARASNFSNFKSTFGPNKHQMLNSQNIGLSKVNILVSSKQKLDHFRYTKTFLNLKLDNEDEWREEQNVNRSIIL